MLITGHLVGGPCDQSIGKVVIRAPFDGAIVGTAAEGGWNEANAAIQAAKEAFATWRDSPASDRAQLLHRVAELVRARA
jgi:acyl-CoA reductase-like NAD-dependent aldehyde dehydrogenase